MNVLIVDDSIHKLSDVSKVLIDTNLTLNIGTVEDIQSAMAFLKENTIDLLILDQYLPERKGKNAKILTDGGFQLLSEISRKAKKINTPKYVIGLSQYANKCPVFSDIWCLIEYSPTHTKWHNPLIKIINHISESNVTSTSDNLTKELLPTLFVEGLTDVDLFNFVLNRHFIDVKDKFIITSQKNAGANWVAQQLVIWGHQLSRNSENELVKAIGLFDSDEAGIKAKNDAIKKLNSSNQQEAVKIGAIQAKHSLNILEFYKRGLQIEIEIESLLPIKLLNYADEQGWLEYRNPLFIDLPKDWDQMTETLTDYLNRINFPNDLRVYLKKIKISKKEQFIKFVLKEANKSIEILDNLKSLLSELINKHITKTRN
ncbi:response regulator [Aquimarina sp. 2-A2]|uniref:response regulator n=1 Tax=Aquimarina sp. 2-A2 TaxID=3382644 RepID=UPI00387F18B9